MTADDTPGFALHKDDCSISAGPVRGRGRHKRIAVSIWRVDRSGRMTLSADEALEFATNLRAIALSVGATAGEAAFARGAEDGD